MAKEVAVRALDAVTLEDDVAALAKRLDAADTMAMRLINRVSSKIETGVTEVLGSRQGAVQDVVEAALRSSYGLATRGKRLGDMGDRGSVALSGISGAVGGFFGAASAFAELPVAITLILRSIQEVAQQHGYDPEDLQTRAEVLSVFASGSPMASDDGVNTGLIGTKLTITGASLDALLRRFVPAIAARMTQKLGTQAVPVLGAVTGAALNMIFANYYREVAHYHFGRLRLIELYGEAAVVDAEARARVERLPRR